MRPLPPPLKAAALCLAALCTLLSHAAIHALALHGTAIPEPPLAGGLDVDPTKRPRTVAGPSHIGSFARCRLAA